MSHRQGYGPFTDDIRKAATFSSVRSGVKPRISRSAIRRFTSFPIGKDLGKTDFFLTVITYRLGVFRRLTGRNRIKMEKSIVTGE